MSTLFSTVSSFLFFLLGRKKRGRVRYTWFCFRYLSEDGEMRKQIHDLNMIFPYSKVCKCIKYISMMER